MALTADEVREAFAYDPLTGILLWKKPGYGVTVGAEAGSIDGNGRRMVQFRGRSYHASRLIWLLMTGAWPQGVVDHKDRDRLNNRWENLRDVTQAINCQNRSVGKNNTSSVSGVYWVPREGKWKAQITAGRVKHRLGTFANFEQAVAARKEAESKVFQRSGG